MERRSFISVLAAISVNPFTFQNFEADKSYIPELYRVTAIHVTPAGEGKYSIVAALENNFGTKISASFEVGLEDLKLPQWIHDWDPIANNFVNELDLVTTPGIRFR